MVKFENQIRKLTILQRRLDDVEYDEGYCLDCHKIFSIDSIQQHSNCDVILKDPSTPQGNEIKPIQLVIQKILE